MKKLLVTAVAMGSFVATSASAAIDTTDAVAAVETGIVALGAIGAAFLGLTILKRVWSKVGG